MKNLVFLLLSSLFTTQLIAQDSDSPLVSFSDYEMLMAKVKEHRKTRLVDLDAFNQLSTDENVYILDTRSKEMYDRKHVKGAIHLNFSDFTQANLDNLFQRRDVKILIYCNNNFIDQIQIDEVSLKELLIQDMNFASKVSYPQFDIQVEPYIERGGIDELIEPIEGEERTEVIEIEKPITLALNIPTYINLYGYGYRNVYELSELVSVRDPRIQFEGSEVATAQVTEK